MSRTEYIASVLIPLACSEKIGLAGFHRKSHKVPSVRCENHGRHLKGSSARLLRAKHRAGRARSQFQSTIRFKMHRLLRMRPQNPGLSHRSLGSFSMLLGTDLMSRIFMRIARPGRSRTMSTKFFACPPLGDLPCETGCRKAPNRGRLPPAARRGCHAQR